MGKMSLLGQRNFICFSVFCCSPNIGLVIWKLKLLGILNISFFLHHVAGVIKTLDSGRIVRRWPEVSGAQ